MANLPAWMKGASVVEDTPPKNAPSGELPAWMKDASVVKDDSFDAGRAAMQFFWGANKEIEKILNAPAWLAHQITGPILDVINPDKEHPFNPPVKLETGQSFDNPEPRNMLERLAQSAGSVVGGSIPYAAAPFLAPAGKVASIAGRAVQSIAESYKAAPLRSAVGELSSAIGAGVGAGLANEAAPNSELAALAGGLIGGLAPGAAYKMSPARVAVKYGIQGIRSVTTPKDIKLAQSSKRPDFFEQQAAQNIADELAPAIKPYGGELQRAQDISEKIKGFSPSLAEATGSPSLIATQRRLEANMSGQNLEDASARYSANERAINRYAEKVAPQGDTSPSMIVDSASGKIEALQSSLDQKADALASQRRELAPRRTLDIQETGNLIRDKIDEARFATKKEMSDLADSLGLNSSKVAEDPADFINAVRQGVDPGIFTGDRIPSVYHKLSALEDAATKTEAAPAGSAVITTSPEMAQTLSKLRVGNKPVFFKDVMDLRTALSDDLRDEIAARGTGSASRIAALKTMQKNLDNYIMGLDDKMGSAYKQFRKTYYDKFITPYEQGVVFNVGRKTPRGDYRTNAEQVASKFWGPGKVTEMQQYMKALGNDKEAVSAIASYALDDFARVAVKDGVIDTAASAKWIKDHRTVIDQVPGLSGVINKTESLNSALAARQAQLEGRAKDIQSSLLGKQIAQFQKGKQPAEVLQAALKDERLMRQIVFRLSPDARKGLSRYVWDAALSEKGNVSESTLKLVLGPDHYKNVQDIQAALEIAGRMSRPAGSAVENTALGSMEKFLGMGLPQLGSRLFAYQSGRVGGRFVLLDSALRFLRGRILTHQAAMMKEAIYDPEVARDIAALIRVRGDKKSLGEKLSIGLVKRLNTRMFTMGLIAPQEPEQQAPEQQAPTNPPTQLQRDLILNHLSGGT
jgi:hypothetical protein